MTVPVLSLLSRSDLGQVILELARALHSGPNIVVFVRRRDEGNNHG